MLLLERITLYAEDVIGRYQSGFRKRKSTTDHIFTLKQTMEKHEFNRIYARYLLITNKLMIVQKGENYGKQ